MKENIVNQYQTLFDFLHPFISYSASRITDFQSLEAEGRAAVQAIADQTQSLKAQLEKDRQEAERILQEVRAIAAEQGVSQQAIYYGKESEHHEERAEKWRITTLWWASGVIGFAFISLFLHKIPFLSPSNAFDAYQLIASKILIFITLSYMVILSARNFLSHRHNAVINKHRQNALVTFKALVDAGGVKESRDIVLKSLASSVFSPQDTGYVKVASGPASSTSAIVELGSQLSDQG
ncbi:MAG: hypothetical protein AAF899_04340 [Pseudomonadota bacterium]